MSLQGIPSRSRRERLLKAEPNIKINILSFTPIIRYYEIASKLFESFRETYEQKDLDGAYVLGKRYAKFCMDFLPTHNYYYSSQEDLQRLRIENHRKLSVVANMLEQVVLMMDQEELKRGTIQQSTSDFDLPEPPTGFLRRKEFASKKITSETRIKREESGPSYMNSFSLPHEAASSNDGQFDRDITSRTNFSHKFPTSPPPYTACMTDHASINDLSRSLSVLHFSSPSISTISAVAEGYEVTPTIETELKFPTAPAFSSSMRNIDTAPLIRNHNKIHLNSPEDTPICIHDLHTVYSQEYEDFTLKRLIQVYGLDSYQGRIQKKEKDSTNGCTVISPLVIKNHLNSLGPGISDDAIENVINNEAPPILWDVRRRLGLQQHALIVPSDVHDYLIEKKILLQDKFVGACGGNLLDPEHRGQLIDMLTNGHDHFLKDSAGYKKSHDKSSPNRNNCKVGAALFFHEHVISIVKLVFPDGTFWFDIVDSLPSPSISREDNPVGVSLQSTRIRCKSIPALDATLRWYACSKFTEADKSYINANIWDDALCDFDPRVFQAFVWANKSNTP
jgi:hypothetical protein